MANAPDFTTLFRRATLANIGFYEGWLKLTGNYLENLKLIFGQEQPAAGSRPEAGQSEPSSAALVLEAEAGSSAESCLVVENLLARKVTAEITASPVLDVDGNEAPQKLRFDPSSVRLEPGERTIVQVTADISEKLVPGAGYRGSISIPGLSESPVVVVIRRQHSIGGLDPKEQAAPDKPGARSKSRKKSTAKKARKE